MTSLSIIKSTVGTGQLTKIQRAYKVIAPAYDWLQPLWTGRALGHAEQFLEQRVIPQYCPSVAAVLDMGCGTGANNELVRTYRRHYTFLLGLQKLLLMLPNSWLTRILELISYRPIFNFILEWHQRHAALKSVLKRDAPWETRCTLAGAERSRQTDRGRTAVVHCKGGGNQNR